jgi:vancomycin permeability regulator SanA
MKRTLKLLLKLILAGALIIALINVYMVAVTFKKFRTVEDLEGKDYDCVLVLGAGIWGDEPSPLLRDRIIMGVEAYKAGNIGYILMSGDNQYDYHDEPTVMKNYAIRLGRPEEAIEKDRWGLSTYDSLWRLKNVYGCNKAVIVTQPYHLYRSLYIARGLGIDAVGIASDLQWYARNPIYFAREILARVKEFAWMIIKPQPEHTEK